MKQRAPKRSRSSIPKFVEIALRRHPLVILARMLDAIFKLASVKRELGGDVVGAPWRILSVRRGVLDRLPDLVPMIIHCGARLRFNFPIKHKAARMVALGTSQVGRALHRSAASGCGAHGPGWKISAGTSKTGADHLLSCLPSAEPAGAGGIQY